MTFFAFKYFYFLYTIHYVVKRRNNSKCNTSYKFLHKGAEYSSDGPDESEVILQGSYITEDLDKDNFSSYYALLVAFKTMKERCQQLQSRMIAVEEENVYLKLECEKNMSTVFLKNDNSDRNTFQVLQDKVEELTKQKSQLSHHISMVAAENRKLWSRLTRLTRTNKSLGNQLTKISDTLKQHPPSAQSADILSYSFSNVPHSVKQETNKKMTLMEDNSDKKQSLEEISRKFLNAIKLDKLELEQQQSEVIELQNSSNLNLQNIGFTYPDDSDTDSLEQLKQHDVRLSQTRDVLLAQQIRLKKALQNFKKLKRGGICNNCRKNANKKITQTGTQFDSDDHFREHGATQTSLPSMCLSTEKYSTDNSDVDTKICPLCGDIYEKSVSFAKFHEHVLSHFTEKVSVDGFKLLH